MIKKKYIYIYKINLLINYKEIEKKIKIKNVYSKYNY